mmetsp:Transcript_4171/g.7420  ORF Transcript_4171/g.7420 Transcript_4171/m.7420 type:complete len:1013 (-) Transcript_4171:228-3266(-)
MGGNKQEEINHFGKMAAKLSTRERSTSTSSNNNINNNNSHMNEDSNHGSSSDNGGVRVYRNITDPPATMNKQGNSNGGSPNNSSPNSNSPKQSGSPRSNNKDSSPNSNSNGSSEAGELSDDIANQPPVIKDNIEEGRDNHSPSPAYSTQKVGDLPDKATVSKGRNPRYMGMDSYPVSATPPRMPMNNPPPPPRDNITQFNLNNYRQLSKEERRRLLKEVKMVLGEESLLSGMNDRHSGSADDNDTEEESLLASSEEHSQANTFFSEDRTMYTEDRTMYTADTSAFYTEGDTSTSMSGDDSRRWSNRRSGSRNNSLLSDNEDEFSDEDEHFFSLTDACLSFLCDGNRQEAEEMAKAKRDRREQRQRQRREEDNWNKGGRRYEKQRMREEAEDDETVGTNDNAWKRNSTAWKRNSTTNSGLTVKHRLQSRLKEAKKFESIPEQENIAVTPPVNTVKEQVQDAANETSLWKGDRNTEDDNSSSDDAVIPGGASRGNDNANNIAEVVTEMEPESAMPVAKSPSLKITLSYGDEPVDEPVDCNEGGKFSKGRSLTMKERSSSPFVRAMSSLSKQRSRLDKATATAVTVKQDPSVCSTKTSSDESTARSAKTTKSAKSSSGSVKSSKSTKSIIPRNAKAWKEYVDSNTGNKYYSDGTTTTWERPANARIVSGSRSGTPTTPIAGSANKPSYSVAATPVVSNKSAVFSKKATASPSSSVEKEQAVDMPPRVVNTSRRKKLKLFSKYKKKNTTKKTTQQSNKNSTTATTTSNDPDGPFGAVTRWSRSMSRAKKRNDDDDPVAADPASPDRTEASAGSINSEGGNSPVSLTSHIVPMNSPLANIVTNNDHDPATANDGSYDDIVTHTVTASVTSRPRNGSSNDSKNSKSKTTTTPSANSTPKRKKKKGWKEFNDPTSGKKYYSDGVTTTWNRPANFNGNSSPVTSHVTATSATSFDPAAAAATSKSPLPKISSNSDHQSQKTDKAKTKRKKKGWREFTDTNTGTKYYSDGVTTTWDRPANF